MLLTPYQELQAVYLGRFIALAEMAEFSNDHGMENDTVNQLIDLWHEFRQKDAELLKQLRTVKGPSGTFEIDGEKVPFRSEIKKND